MSTDEDYIDAIVTFTDKPTWQGVVNWADVESGEVSVVMTEPEDIRGDYFVKAPDELKIIGRKHKRVSKTFDQEITDMSTDELEAAIARLRSEKKRRGGKRAKVSKSVSTKTPREPKQKVTEIDVDSEELEII